MASNKNQTDNLNKKKPAQAGLKIMLFFFDWPDFW